MKRLLLGTLLACWLTPGLAQKAHSTRQAINFVKLANTLRALDRPQQAINLLVRALPAEQSKDVYLQAITHEVLGLAYHEVDNNADALRHLQQARRGYDRLKYYASSWALNELIRDISDKNLYAGIQITASDVKLAIFRTTYKGGFYEKDIKSKFEAPNATVAGGTGKAARAGQDAIQTCLDSIRYYKIPRERIFVVTSSDVTAELAKTPVAKKKLFDQLAGVLPPGSTALDTTLTADRAAELFTIGAIPRKVWPTTSALDIGSTSIMGGYFDEGNTFHAVSLPTGPLALAGQIESKRALNLDAYKREAQRVIKDLADKDIPSTFSRGKAELQQRPTVGVGGDIAFALVTYLHPERSTLTAVYISPEDIEQFKTLALTNYQRLITPDLSKLTDQALRRKAEADIQAVQRIFTEKQLIAGALLLDTIYGAYASPTLPKRFVFIRDADIGWVTGKFLQTLNQEYEQTIAKGARYAR